MATLPPPSTSTRWPSATGSPRLTLRRISVLSRDAGQIGAGDGQAAGDVGADGHEDGGVALGLAGS